MTASNSQAVASAIGLVITGVLRLAQDPTVRLVAQNSEVIAAWRDAYGPVKHAIRVTTAVWKQIGEANRLATA